MSLLNLSLGRMLAALSLVGLGCGGPAASVSDSGTGIPKAAAASQVSRPATQAGSGEEPGSIRMAVPTNGKSAPDASVNQMDGSASVDPKCAAGTFDSTFAAIQKVIFEGNHCTNDSCHGAAASGGLDLRQSAAYLKLGRDKLYGEPAAARDAWATG